MITVYSADTPNGIKIPIALEELDLPYRLIRLDLGAGEQRSPDYLKLNPNARIPALVDTAGPLGEEALFESGAILWYLGERYPGLLPGEAAARLRALQGLTLQVAGLGPMFGQAGFFLRSAPQKIDFAIDRYVGEARRLTGVLEGRLARSTWLAGETYSIADIAHFGWLANPGYADVDLADYPRVREWAAAIAERPAVRRARQRMQVTPVGMAMSPTFAG